jgi:hypothetical protein
MVIHGHRYTHKHRFHIRFPLFLCKECLQIPRNILKWTVNKTSEANTWRYFDRFKFHGRNDVGFCNNKNFFMRWTTVIFPYNKLNIMRLISQPYIFCIGTYLVSLYVLIMWENIKHIITHVILEALVSERNNESTQMPDERWRASSKFKGSETLVE